jgi:endonuclease/exonuclease/phosphatase (EEP) superfamily protein YafD
MLLAEVGWSPGRVAVLVTHIPRSNELEREIQLETVLDLFASLAPPAILLADLNTPPGTPRMEQFLAQSDAVDGLAAGGLKDTNRVDWILVRGLECVEARRVDNDASDHPLFTVRLRRPDMPTSGTTNGAPHSR